MEKPRFPQQKNKHGRVTIFTRTCWKLKRRYHFTQFTRELPFALWQLPYTGWWTIPHFQTPKDHPTNRRWLTILSSPIGRSPVSNHQNLLKRSDLICIYIYIHNFELWLLYIYMQNYNWICFARNIVFGCFRYTFIVYRNFRTSNRKQW
jgi:hypothetical protein